MASRRLATRRALGLALLASTVVLCAADWRGTYEGSEAGDHRMVLRGEADALVIQLFRVTIDEPSGCHLRIEDCPALLDASGGAFLAGPCPASLAGPEGVCSGSVDLQVRGAALADNGTAVTRLRVESTLNDWPVVLRRVRSCGLGLELVGLAPLLALRARRRRPARRSDDGAV